MRDAVQQSVALQIRKIFSRFKALSVRGVPVDQLRAEQLLCFFSFCTVCALLLGVLC